MGSGLPKMGAGMYVDITCEDTQRIPKESWATRGPCSGSLGQGQAGRRAHGPSDD